MLKRRDFFKKVTIGLGAACAALSLPGCGNSTTDEEVFGVTTLPHQPWLQKLLEDVNFHFCAVFTHVLSLRKRRCLEVTESAIKEASYAIVAILYKQIKDFHILKVEINKTYCKVWYRATFLKKDKKEVKDFSSMFYFQLLGGPGDPTHTRPI